MTKTTSIRLDEELLEEIDERCVKNECNRNDWIKLAIENQLEMEASDEEEQPKATLTPIEDNHSDKKPYTDSLGNRLYWNYNTNDWVCEINPKNIRIIDD